MGIKLSSDQANVLTHYIDNIPQDKRDNFISGFQSLSDDSKLGLISDLTTKLKPSLENSIESGNARVAEAIPQRRDLLGMAGANLMKPSIDVGKAMMPLEVIGGVFQRGQAAISNPAMAGQDMVKNINQQGLSSGVANTFKNSATGMLQGLTGQKLGEFGDVYSRAGVSPLVASSLGLATDLAGSAGVSEVLGGTKFLPKVHTDKVVNEAGQQIVDKITSAREGLTNSYKAMIEPHNGNIVSADKFGNLIKMLPKELQDDFGARFGNAVTNASGKQVSTVGKLQEMKDALNDLIKGTKEATLTASKEQIGRLSNYGAKLANVVKATKDTYLGEIPQVSRDVVRQLDDVYGEVVPRGNAILGQVLKKGGEINTKYLASIFKNPDSSGARELLRSMSDYGIDLSDPIRTISQYAGRQTLKKVAANAISKVPGIGIGASIAKLLE